MAMTPARAVSIFKGHEHKPGEHGANHDPNAGKEALPWWGTMFLFGLATLYVLDGIVKERLGLVGGEGQQTWMNYGLKASLFIPGALIGYLIAARLNLVLGWTFRRFNKSFDFVTKVYGRTIAGLLRIFVIALFVYVGLLALTGRYLTTTPVGFIPMQDKGYLIVSVQLPDAASLQRTSEVIAQLDDLILGPIIDPKTRKRDSAKGIPGVAHTVSVSGYSVILSASGTNYGSVFVTLDDFDKRKGNPDKNGFHILFELQAKARRQIQDAVISVYPPPPVDGLGTAGGFKLMVESRGDLTPQELGDSSNALIKEMLPKKPGESTGISIAVTQFRADVPQLFIDIDRVKCKQLGVNLSDVNNTLQVYLGGAYVNDFNRFGRTWQVNLQADAKFRITPEYVRNMKVRNVDGTMIELGSLCRVEDTTGPAFIQRYNLYPSAAVVGNLAPGTSTGQGVNIIEAAADKALPKQATYEWTELTYMQLKEGNAAVFAFIGAVVLVYLVLAAQYESWTMPLAIILVVPMCVLSSLIGVRAVGLDMNIFVQVGFIVLVGLAAKNAILIVEFAAQSRKAGMPLKESVLHSVEQRLRPIIMTSFAFILGVVPLVVAEGAGSEMRKTLGIAVFSGMIGVTAFGLFLTPVFAYAIGKLSRDPVKPPPATTIEESAQATPPAHG